MPPPPCSPQVLNFSIAYGKTAHGLSKDWGVSHTEAQAMVDAWSAQPAPLTPHADP